MASFSLFRGTAVVTSCENRELNTFRGKKKTNKQKKLHEYVHI